MKNEVKKQVDNQKLKKADKEYKNRWVKPLVNPPVTQGECEKCLSKVLKDRFENE